MDFSTGNWRVREAVAEDVPDILQMIKVLNRKLKIPQNLNYAIINSPTRLVLTPDHNKVETVQLQKLSFVVKDYSLNTVVWVIGAMSDP